MDRMVEVVITETLSKRVMVRVNGDWDNALKKATDFVEDLYKKAKITLDGDDFDNVEIEVESSYAVVDPDYVIGVND